MAQREYVIKPINWSTEDFEYLAIQKYGYDWEKYYDFDKFEDALESMIHHHDAEYGICWETLKYYLDEMCKIDEKGDDDDE